MVMMRQTITKKNFGKYLAQISLLFQPKQSSFGRMPELEMDGDYVYKLRA